MDKDPTSYDICYLPRQDLQRLLDALQDHGYHCTGPQVRDGTIVYDTLSHVDQLPQGIRDEQQPGHYTLHKNDESRYFAWANGPQALKPLTFKARETLWAVERNEQGRLEFRETHSNLTPTAVIGVRACDLAALRLQERIFLHDQNPDPYYAARREKLLLVAVNCSHPAATCFCASTGDGPHASHSYDLVLTELQDGYTVQAGSDRGADIVNGLSLPLASDAQHYEAGRQQHEAVQAQSRSLPDGSLRDTLFARLDHPRWDDVAERCLSCGNCTSVCPSCFCHSEHDDADLDGAATEHVRQWDSCFSEGHSYLHGKVLRDNTRLRYRQWLTHKLGSWHDQFGSSGCVGCGRCITWCPVGIDITEEAKAICADPDGGDS
jgi:ferredoxin